MKNNYIKSVASCLALIIATFSIPAQSLTASTNACEVGGLVFGYFNGIMTSRQQASEALKHMKTIYGDTSPQGDKIRYETFFNLSQGLFTDLAEVFIQRMAEQDQPLVERFELFWESMSSASEWWDLIIGNSTPLRTLQESLSNTVQAAAAQASMNLLAPQTPSTTFTGVEQSARLDTLAIEGKKLLFFAHSQGNLFANTAYQYVSNILPAGTVKLVHVAPASARLNGDYVLADLDRVINLQRSSGMVPPSNVSIPPPFQRTPGVNNETDPLGHGLLAIYLNPGLDTSAMVNAAVIKAMTTMVAPPVRAQSGFFTISLIWDGLGDIDLHTYEPDGSHVYFSRRQGTSGYLDVDNQTGFGPEHYYATCNAERIQTGTYRVALANYARGQGRIATVQVASSADGVLATKPVILGAPTQSTPSIEVFHVDVTRDSTGKLSARAS